MKKFLKVFFDENLELRERLFRNIIYLGSLAGLVAVVESYILGNLWEVLIPLVLLFFILIVATYLTMKYHKIDITAFIVYLIITGVMFPIMFFKNGGIRGGATVWFVYSICYIFLMYRGRKQWILLGISVWIDIVCYYIGYKHPQWITPLQSEFMIYLDSAFSVFAVGITMSLMIRSQMNMFEKERVKNRQQTLELEKAGNYRNTFFTNVSHEIRTPLNAIIGFHDMILREEVSEKVKEYVKNSAVASEMLLTMLNDVLDVSLIESNQMELFEADYEIGDLLNETLRINKLLAEEKGLEFLVNIDENLPGVLRGDKKRIQQIMMNILSNAIKYTAAGSIIFTVTAENVSQEMGAKKILLRFSVQDTGIGIKSEDLSDLYDGFKRFGTKGENTKGTGLGLYITKQLIDLMGGSIFVDSIYKRGTTFTVELIQEVTDATKIGQFVENQESFGKSTQYFEAPEARILIVDDDYISRSVAQNLLERTKIRVDTAQSGMECLEKTKRKYYHAILINQLMPDMKGEEIRKKVSSQENGLCKDTPVLLITANQVVDTRRIYQENGFDGYLQKPYSASDLEQELFHILPEDLVEYSTNQALELKYKRSRKQNRKELCIATDSLCEIPEEWIEKYHIHMMNLYISTAGGRFADTKEIYSNYMAEYLTKEVSHVKAVSASVEEYEEFFAEELIHAKDVIFISMAADVGISYSNAKQAAKGFDHVHVIDSGQISGGQCLLVMKAVKLAAEGLNVKEVIELLHQTKHNIENRFLIHSPAVFSQNGFMAPFTSKLMTMLHLHPSLRLYQGKLSMTGVYGGEDFHYRKLFAKNLLRFHKHVNPTIVIITHVSCSYQELEELKKAILSKVPFQHVIIQNASVSNACNAGLKTIGISYMKQP